MSSNIRPIRSPDTITPAVVGYVEAMTEAAALGWVWCPGRSDRIRVELRLDTETIATAVADGLREDLARGGIGDGRHAFSLAITDEVRSRSEDLKVVAVRDDGETTVLQAPVQPGGATSEELGRVLRGIDLLISSQRLLHRNLQAALLQKVLPESTSLADIASAQAELRQGIDTIELFVVRLETALAAREPTIPVPRPSRATYAALALSGLAFLASALALGRVILAG